MTRTDHLEIDPRLEFVLEGDVGREILIRFGIDPATIDYADALDHAVGVGLPHDVLEHLRVEIRSSPRFHILADCENRSWGGVLDSEAEERVLIWSLIVGRRRIERHCFFERHEQGKELKLK